MSSSKRKNHEISFVADVNRKMTWVINMRVAVLPCKLARVLFAKTFNFGKKGERQTNYR